MSQNKFSTFSVLSQVITMLSNNSNVLNCLLIVLFRPIAGYVNFCPSAFTNTNDDTLFIIVKHEILHALVSHVIK